MPDIERILELEKEDRLRPRLKDRDKWDWLYMWNHPLHRHDVELFMYYLHIGLLLYGVRIAYKYFAWVKSEFVRAKERDDEVMARIAEQKKQQQQQNEKLIQEGKRSYSTAIGKQPRFVENTRKGHVFLLHTRSTSKLLRTSLLRLTRFCKG